MRRLHFLAALSLTLGGCMSYAQTSISELEPEQKVRVVLDDAEVPRLLEYVDDRTRSVSGTFLREEDDSVVVVLSSPGSYAEVSIPKTGILTAERGKVSATKNIIGSAAIVGAIAAAAVMGFDGGGGENPDVGGGTDEFRPLLLISIPLTLFFGR